MYIGSDTIDILTHATVRTHVHSQRGARAPDPWTRRVDTRGADGCEGNGGKRAEEERYAHGGDCAMHRERYLARHRVLSVTRVAICNRNWNTLA